MLFLAILVLSVCVLPRGSAKWLSMPPRTPSPDRSALKKHLETSPTGGEGWTRSWGQQLLIIIYKTGKRKGPTIEHRELYSISWDKPSWERM